MVRSEPDRKVYTLPGFGALRRRAWYSVSAEAVAADGTAWTFAHTSWTGRGSQATDRYGSVVGRIRWRGFFGQQADVEWGGRTYRARRVGVWTMSVQLWEQDRKVLTTWPGRWNAKLARVDLDESARLDPGLVLFVVWQAQTSKESSSAAASS